MPRRKNAQNALDSDGNPAGRKYYAGTQISPEEYQNLNAWAVVKNTTMAQLVKASLDRVIFSKKAPVITMDEDLD